MKILVGITAMVAAISLAHAAEVRQTGMDVFGYSTNMAEAKERGRADAERDVRGGVLRIPSYGLPAAWAGEYDRILKEKYGIGRYGLAGCMVSDGLVAYAEGYSEVTSREIEKKFGADLFKRVRVEAEESYNRKFAQPAVEKPVDPGAYSVRAGDTLTSIARRHHTTVSQIKYLNGLQSDRIQVNQKLRLPPATKTTNAFGSKP